MIFSWMVSLGIPGVLMSSSQPSIFCFFSVICLVSCLRIRLLAASPSTVAALIAPVIFSRRAAGSVMVL